ncbi:hypothetical protein [Geobacter grbiciae]|uniref:hypothetical protein n=1 Tax=Geobacter grbiciae TaxID=155042 RepID=UPI001C0387DC|nr:hypothetical protein [Geobacter grbiciae]MBT1075670.1 hypothetical protein [Geobacter grbiciae]
MKRNTIVSLAAGLASLIPVTVGAVEIQANTSAQQALLNTLLKGSYAFTASRTCVQTPYSPGFDQTTRQLLTDGETVGFIESGTLTFSGTGSVKGDNITVAVMEPAKAIAGSAPMQNGITSSCAGTYSVNPNRSYSATLTCTSQLGNGLSLAIGPAAYQGSVDVTQNMLTISETGGNIQAVTVAIGGTPVQSFDRVCTSSGTLIRTGK